jgi:signal peptidase I
MVKGIKKLFDLVLVLIIIILSAYYALRITNKVEIFAIMTGSMEENIHAGDYILIMRKNDYHINDVVTFRKDGTYITHRIIKEEGEYFITKGDANNTEDDKIEKSSVVGKVIISGGVLNFVIRYKYVLIGALLSLYLAGWLISDYREIKKEEKTKLEESLKADKPEEKVQVEQEEIKEQPDEDKKEEKIKEEKSKKTTKTKKPSSSKKKKTATKKTTTKKTTTKKGTTKKKTTGKKTTKKVNKK